MSFCAEEWFGVADITGAFIAGLLLSNTSHSNYIASRFETLSYTLLSPIFFASVGLSVVLNDMNMMLILFAIILLLTAIATKIVGCGLGARMTGSVSYTHLDVYKRQVLGMLYTGIGLAMLGAAASFIVSFIKKHLATVK